MRLSRRVGMGIMMAVAGVLLAGASDVWAGPLTPTGPPGSSSVTLNEVDAKLSQSLGLSTVPGYIPPDSAPTLISGQDGKVATPILLTLTGGGATGEVTGSVATEGFEGTIAVFDFDHEVAVERDGSTGVSTGRRNHEPIKITKPVDKSTPLLYQILVNNENISELKLSFFRVGEGGKAEPFYSIELENARIDSIASEYPNREHVSFAYQKVTWTWAETGTTAEDDWTPPEGK